MRVLKDYLEAGNLIVTLVAIVLTSVFTVGFTYAMMIQDIEDIKADVKSNISDIKINREKIGDVTQSQIVELNDAIQELDKIYVRDKELELLKQDLGGRLDRMNSNINYLIRLQTEGGK